MSTFEQTSVELTSSDGCRIAAWHNGNPAGRAVVLLHGFSLDHAVWDRVRSDPGLSERCHLVAPDLRGHGRSGRPADIHGYTNGKLWADDLKTIVDSLALDRPIVVGWSYSGRAVNDYLRHHGSINVAGVVFVAAATLADPSAIGPAHRCLAELCSSEPEIEQAASSTFLREVLQQVPGSESYEKFAAALARTTPQQRTWLRSRALDYDGMLAELDLPVLVCHGAEDSVVLPVLAQKLGAVMRQARISIYPTCGHAPFIEDPRRFCEELLQFVVQTDAERCAASITS